MKNYLCAAAALCLMASCSSSEDIPVTDNTADDLIRINASVGNPSRAGYDNTNLDRFGLIINNSLDAAYSYNVAMTKSGTSWAPADATTLLWDKTRSTVNVCAYAPVMDNLTLSNFTVTVPAEYSSADDMKAADFLLMRKDVNPKTDLDANGMLNINLGHKLSKLIINLTGASVTDLRVNGTALSGQIDLASATPSINPSHSSIFAITPLLNADGSYECMIIPQTAHDFTVTFSANGRDYSWSPDAEVTFKENMVYTLPLNVKVQTVNATLDNISVSAWDNASDSELTID